MTQVIKKPNSRITYYVNEEKGVVVAKLKKWDMVTDTNLYLLNHNLPTIEPALAYDRYYDGYFTGKAICSKDDKFDLETGMRIARNRALFWYYCEKDSLITQTYRNLENKFNRLRKYSYQQGQKLKKIINSLEEDNA